MDDAGMSYDPDIGIEQVLEKGVARLLSVMMPTPWVAHIVHYIEAHVGTDAGLHLTLTSEWRDYRWGPLAGAASVPSLVDPEGALWASVAEVDLSMIFEKALLEASYPRSPIAEAIRSLRIDLGDTQQEFAHCTELSVVSIARYETNALPKKAVLTRLRDECRK